jgi:hypothetical protein
LNVLALLAAAAVVQPPVDPMRCMLIAWVDARDKDPNAAQAGRLTAMYWMGRVNSIIPDKDLASRFSAEAHAMDNIDVQADAERCDTEVTAQTTRLQQTSQALMEEAAKPPAPPK